MDDVWERLGANVRLLRESQGVSLTQLAVRTGVAKSTLSQLEAGSANPTLATMDAVAKALSVDVPRLLGESPRAGVLHVRKGAGADVSGQSSAAELMRSALVGPSVVEFHRIRLEAGTHESSPSHGAGSFEHVLVVSGTVHVGPPDAQVLAGPGDYVSYPGDAVHRFEAGDTAAEYWIVATFPRSLSG